MAPSTDRFVKCILALLLPLGPVEARRMFSGYGLYLEGTIFGLAFDGELFLKADEKTKGDFEKRGLGPLTYEGRRGQEIALPYWEAPKSLMKDGKTLCRWARKAYEAGLRFDARKNKKGGKRKSGESPSATRPTTMRFKSRRGPRYKPDF